MPIKKTPPVAPFSVSASMWANTQNIIASLQKENKSLRADLTDKIESVFKGGNNNKRSIVALEMLSKVQDEKITLLLANVDGVLNDLNNLSSAVLDLQENTSAIPVSANKMLATIPPGVPGLKLLGVNTPIEALKIASTSLYPIFTLDVISPPPPLAPVDVEVK